MIPENRYIVSLKLSGKCVLGVLYFDVLQLAPLFNLSFDPNIKIKDPYAYRKKDIQLWRECQEHSATYRLV